VNRLPHLQLMPQALRDIKRCVEFIRAQPWGKPQDRLRDILGGISRVSFDPHRAPVKAYRPLTGQHLRRYSAAQFVIVYAYIPPNRKFPLGAVSIRAIRHRRVRDVFAGVKEREAPPYGILSNAAELTARS
jgi:hypothetical protein